MAAGRHSGWYFRDRVIPRAIQRWHQAHRRAGVGPFRLWWVARHRRLRARTWSRCVRRKVLACRIWACRCLSQYQEFVRETGSVQVTQIPCAASSDGRLSVAGFCARCVLLVWLVWCGWLRWVGLAGCRALAPVGCFQNPHPGMRVRFCDQRPSLHPFWCSSALFQCPLGRFLSPVLLALVAFPVPLSLVIRRA